MKKRRETKRKGTQNCHCFVLFIFEYLPFCV
jgi:hypothetical protein